MGQLESLHTCCHVTNYSRTLWLRTKTALLPLVSSVSWAQLGESLAPQDVGWGSTVPESFQTADVGILSWAHLLP